MHCLFGFFFQHRFVSIVFILGARRLNLFALAFRCPLFCIWIERDRERNWKNANIKSCHVSFFHCVIVNQHPQSRLDEFSIRNQHRAADQILYRWLIQPKMWIDEKKCHKSLIIGVGRNVAAAAHDTSFSNCRLDLNIAIKRRKTKTLGCKSRLYQIGHLDIAPNLFCLL